MAYQSKNLSVLAYANGFTLWHYVSGDSADDLLAEGYWNDATDMLRRGDMILCNLQDGDAAANLLVMGSAAKSVDMALLWSGPDATA